MSLVHFQYCAAEQKNPSLPPCLCAWDFWTKPIFVSVLCLIFQVFHPRAHFFDKPHWTRKPLCEWQLIVAGTSPIWVGVGGDKKRIRLPPSKSSLKILLKILPQNPPSSNCKILLSWPLCVTSDSDPLYPPSLSVFISCLVIELLLPAQLPFSTFTLAQQSSTRSWFTFQLS